MTGETLRICLTGGTGFVGGHLARGLRERGHDLRALVRDPRQAPDLRRLGVDIVEGDVTREAGLGEAVAGCQVVIHLVGIIREGSGGATFDEVHRRGTERMVEAARAAGVRKFVHMSALGARPDAPGMYHRSNFAGEEVVRRSGIPHVIFRPSVIAGEGGRFLDLLLRLVGAMPIIPVIGDGTYRLQPVDIQDVVAAFTAAAERGDLIDRCFELGGPHKLTFNRILEIVCEELERPCRTVHVPVSLVRSVAGLGSMVPLHTPISPEELQMLLEENVVPGEANALRDVFDREPASFRAVVQRARSS